jgi:hypothetical protein
MLKCNQTPFPAEGEIDLGKKDKDQYTQKHNTITSLHAGICT